VIKHAALEFTNFRHRLFHRTSMSRSGGTKAAPDDHRTSFCAGRLDGVPSRLVHLWNSMSKRETRMAIVMRISGLGEEATGTHGHATACCIFQLLVCKIPRTDQKGLGVKRNLESDQ